VGLIRDADLAATIAPPTPAEELRLGGASLLLCPAAIAFRRGDRLKRAHLARRTRLPVALVNAVGGNDDLVFDGGSLVVDGEGREVARLPLFREAVECIDLSGPLRSVRASHPPDEEELFGALVLGVRGFVDKNGLPRAILGLSGGVDSALVACVAAEALGPERVTALALPSRFTDPHSTESARELASRLRIGFDVLPIDALHRACRETLGGLLRTDGGPDLVDENLQARLRTVVLLAWVNRHGGVLLNTSNRTERALGYGTVNGDLAGTLSVIGDIPKPLVYSVARWHAETYGSIPAFILGRPPTAELAADQVDPFDYAVVSPVADALLTGARVDDDALAQRLRTVVRTAEHKRAMGGLVLQILGDGSGRSRLMPVTRAW
jgi:NAD+ synthetase